MLTRLLVALTTLFALLTLLLSGLALVWGLRPNRDTTDLALEADVWPIVADGWHNSNTDLIYWRDAFYLVHARSRYHMGNDGSRLIIRRSTDGRDWSELAELSVPDEDIRDPKFAVRDDTLYLYALANNSFEPEPYGTVLSTSRDGLAWSPFEPIEPRGWLLWSPRSLDDGSWYATAYWHEHGRSALFRSDDGRTWEMVSEIHQGDRNDETALEFLPDGQALVTARLEGDDRAWHQGSKDASTLLATASPPYTDWATTRSLTSRLDGPALFTHNGRVYAVGRYDPESRESWYGISSVLGRKRTAVYEVTPTELRLLSVLPSAGDTSYAGVVLKDGALYTSYYTNDPARDVPWVMGLVLPSDILMARIPLDRLEALADRVAGGG